MDKTISQPCTRLPKAWHHAMVVTIEMSNVGSISYVHVMQTSFLKKTGKASPIRYLIYNVQL